MDKKLKEINFKKKHSKFGVISVTIGGFNILLLICYIYLFALWLMANQEILKDPIAINGMPVPKSVVCMILFFLIMQLVGFLSGILGLIEKHKRKLLAIIGIFLNGLLLLITISKLI